MITASAPLPGDPGPLTHTCRTRPALPAPVLVLLVVPLSVSRPQLPWPGQGSQDTCIDGWVFISVHIRRRWECMKEMEMQTKGENPNPSSSSNHRGFDLFHLHFGLSMAPHKTLYQPKNRHPTSKPLPIEGGDGDIRFYFSPSAGAQLGLFLVLGLEEGRWTPAPAPEPFCASAWRRAWVRFPHRTLVAWAGTGIWCFSVRCLCSSMWEVWV